MPRVSPAYNLMIVWGNLSGGICKSINILGFSLSEIKYSVKSYSTILIF